MIVGGYEMTLVLVLDPRSGSGSGAHGESTSWWPQTQTLAVSAIECLASGEYASTAEQTAGRVLLS